MHVTKYGHLISLFAHELLMSLRKTAIAQAAQFEGVRVFAS